jgi:DNA-binding response OmpR family regulator
MPMKKILVVDDEQDILRLLEAHLKASGYEVLMAADGNDGLNKAKTEKPDLIILDLMLPFIDGIQICRMLKFDVLYKHIPIIILTAKSMKEDLELGKQVGADTYVTKPFDYETLLITIKGLLEKAEAVPKTV